MIAVFLFREEKDIGNISRALKTQQMYCVSQVVLTMFKLDIKENVSIYVLDKYINDIDLI